MTDDLEAAIGPDRRTFIRRLVIATAFAAPAVTYQMSWCPGRVQRRTGHGHRQHQHHAASGPQPVTQPSPLCGEVNFIGALTLDVDDGPVHLHLVVPPGALPERAIPNRGSTCASTRATSLQLAHAAARP